MQWLFHVHFRFKTLYSSFLASSYSLLARTPYSVHTPYWGRLCSRSIKWPNPLPADSEGTMQVFVQGTSTHAVQVTKETTIEEIRRQICDIEQVSIEVRTIYIGDTNYNINDCFRALSKLSLLKSRLGIGEIREVRPELVSSRSSYSLFIGLVFPLWRHASGGWCIFRLYP